MPRLSDLIDKAKAGKQVRELLRLEDSQQSRFNANRLDASDQLIDQIIGVETVFFALPDVVKIAQLNAVLQELELIVAEL